MDDSFVFERKILYRPPADSLRLDPATRHSAALGGAKWLIARRVSTPVRRLHRTAGDPRIVAALDESCSVWMKPPLRRVFDHRINNWKKLANAVSVLIRRRSLGIDVRYDVAALRSWLDQNPTQTWYGDPSRMMVCAHLLYLAGVDSRRPYEELAESICNAPRPVNRPGYRKYLGGIIRVLLCESGYLRRRLDQHGYRRELDILRGGLQHYLATGMTGFEADTAAELIIGFKLLQVKNDEQVERMIDWLASLQSADGAWHPPDWPIQKRTHRTSVTVQAVMDWGEQSRWALDMDY